MIKDLEIARHNIEVKRTTVVERQVNFFLFGFELEKMDLHMFYLGSQRRRLNMLARFN
jgi:hypothetical protein